MWRVSSRSGVATLRTAIHLLLTYFYIVHVVCKFFSPLLARAASATSSCLAAVNSKVVLLFWYLPARVVLKKEVGWHIGQPRTNNSDVVWVKRVDWLHGFPGLFTDTFEHIRFYSLVYGLYLPTVILTVVWYSVTHSLFLSRLKTFLLYNSFPLQPFRSFYLNIYYMDSPDCLLLFLGISVFYF